MDVVMPDGTVIEGVPEGTTKAQLQAKLNAKAAPKPPREAPGEKQLPSYGEMMKPSLMNMARDAALGGPMGLAISGFKEGMSNAQTLMDRGAYKAGGAVTDEAMKAGSTPEAAAKMGFGTNVAVQAIPTILGGLLGSSAGREPTKNTAEWLMQTAVKPEQKDRLSGAADKAIRTMLEEGINPTRGGMQKAGEIVDRLHGQVERAVSGSTANVSLDKVGQKYLEQYAKAMNQANPQADLNAVSKAWRQFQSGPLVAGQSEIPVQLAHELKRGTQQALGSKAYGEIKGGSLEAQKALARYLREGVAEAVPEAVAPLKREAALMNVRDVAMNRAIAEGNKNPLGLAALRLDDPLSSLSFMADKSALLKGMLARMLYQGQGVIPTTIGATVGADIGNRSGASK